MLVGSWVDDSLKEKIWSEQFVELIDLLPPFEFDQCPSVQADEYQYDKNGQQRPKKRISSLYMWGKAFDVFMSIWLKKTGNMAGFSPEKNHSRLHFFATRGHFIYF